MNNRHQILREVVAAGETGISTRQVQARIPGMGTSSAYSGMAVLERDGWVTFTWNLTSPRPAKFYTATPLGKAVWQQFQGATPWPLPTPVPSASATPKSRSTG